MAGELAGESAKNGFVSGVVRSALDAPVLRVQIQAEERKIEVARHEDFKVEGAAYSTKICVDADTILLPERSVEGAFGELLDDPLVCDQVMDHAAGDHVETCLRGNILSVGDAVTVYGELSY